MQPLSPRAATRSWRYIVPVTLIAIPAFAQEGASSRSPVDATSTGLPSYRSAFESYKPFQPAQTPAWRQANDRVLSVGGHAGALREAPANPAPSETPSASPRPPVQSVPSGSHGGHK